MTDDWTATTLRPVVRVVGGDGHLLELGGLRFVREVVLAPGTSTAVELAGRKPLSATQEDIAIEVELLLRSGPAYERLLRAVIAKALSANLG